MNARLPIHAQLASLESEASILSALLLDNSAFDRVSRFFAYVSRSDFLTGRSGKWTNCDLGWLMKADNFAKVVQGNYENRGEE